MSPVDSKTVCIAYWFCNACVS